MLSISNTKEGEVELLLLRQSTSKAHGMLTPAHICQKLENGNALMTQPEPPERDRAHAEMYVACPNSPAGARSSASCFVLKGKLMDHRIIFCRGLCSIGT